MTAPPSDAHVPTHATRNFLGDTVSACISARTPSTRYRHRPDGGASGGHAAMRAQVREKLEILQSFLAELETKAARYRQMASDLHVDVPEEAVLAIPVQTSG